MYFIIQYILLYSSNFCDFDGKNGWLKTSKTLFAYFFDQALLFARRKKMKWTLFVPNPGQMDNSDCEADAILLRDYEIFLKKNR